MENNELVSSSWGHVAKCECRPTNKTNQEATIEAEDTSDWWCTHASPIEHDSCEHVRRETRRETRASKPASNTVRCTVAHGDRRNPARRTLEELTYSSFSILAGCYWHWYPYMLYVGLHVWPPVGLDRLMQFDALKNENGREREREREREKENNCLNTNETMRTMPHSMNHFALTLTFLDRLVTILDILAVNDLT